MTFSADLFRQYKERPGKPALARLLERHQDAIYSICRQVLRHPQDAEDACQEVLLEVARHVDAIEEPGAFPGWLYRTALHTALDVRKKLERQRIREAARPAPTPTPDAAGSFEPLYQALAGLDDDARLLVVEHHFDRRTLRELAAERGCSEVAVWKRLEGALERLRKTLGSGALAALDTVRGVRAPRGMIPRALGMKGGLGMTAHGGLALAVGVPLAALAAAGIAIYSRSPEQPEARPPLAAHQARREEVPAPAPEAPAAGFSPLPRPAPDARSAAPRKPYPYRPAGPEPPGAVALTWINLSTKRLSLDLQNEPLATVLSEVSKQTGLLFALDPAGELETSLSFKVQDILADGCLQLLLLPRRQDFEIAPDGRIHVGPRENIKGGYEREARALARPLQELDMARQMVDGGWDGIKDTADPAEAEAADRARKVLIPQGESSLKEELHRLLRKDELNVDLDVRVEGLEDLAARERLLNRRFVQLAGERTLGEHLEALAKESGLVVARHGGILYLTTPEKAAQYRDETEGRRKAYQESVRCLGETLSQTGTLLVQDLLASIEPSAGVRVVPTEDVWNSPKTVAVPAGASLRQGLEALRAQGFRWAILDGKIYVFK